MYQCAPTCTGGGCTRFCARKFASKRVGLGAWVRVCESEGPRLRVRQISPRTFATCGLRVGNKKKKCNNSRIVRRAGGSNNIASAVMPTRNDTPVSLNASGGKNARVSRRFPWSFSVLRADAPHMHCRCHRVRKRFISLPVTRVPVARAVVWRATNLVGVQRIFGSFTKKIAKINKIIMKKTIRTPVRDGEPPCVRRAHARTGLQCWVMRWKRYVHTCICWHDTRVSAGYTANRSYTMGRVVYSRPSLRRRFCKIPVGPELFIIKQTLK